jgi:hypothetical protein
VVLLFFNVEQTFHGEDLSFSVRKQAKITEETIVFVPPNLKSKRAATSWK